MKKKNASRPQQVSPNGTHPPDKNGSDAVLIKSGVQVHLIRLSEQPMHPTEGCNRPTSVVHLKFFSILSKLCSRSIKVRPGKKVRLIGSTEPASLMAMGAFAMRLQKKLGDKRSVLMYQQLCVNAGSGYPAAGHAFTRMKPELSRTDHLIMLLGEAAFYEMLDVLHHEYCNGEEEIKGKKKTALTQRHQFPREEKETAIMVTFYLTKKNYRVKAKTLST